MRTIVFTSRKIPNNSFTMRGIQIALALDKLKYKVKIVNPLDLPQCNNNIIVFIRRTINCKNLITLAKNNIILVDPLDKINEFYTRQLYKYVHGIVFPSKSQYKRFYNATNNIKRYWLLHHWDDRLKHYTFNNFKLGYWGYRTSVDYVYTVVSKQYRFTHTRQLPNNNFFKQVSCYYNVRGIKKGLGWRPTTKISTAAACGANIITSKDAMSLELLPEDYPYWVNDSDNIDIVKHIITTAQNDFGNDRWYYGLQCMDTVRYKTSLTRSARLYGAILEDIDRNF